jgi:hypothetical protein
MMCKRSLRVVAHLLLLELRRIRLFIRVLTIEGLILLLLLGELKHLRV